jgi:hypothetical protein
MNGMERESIQQSISIIYTINISNYNLLQSKECNFIRSYKTSEGGI